MRVIGVTRDTKHYGMDEEMRQGIFQPLAQRPISYNTVVIKTSLDPLSLLPQIRELTRALDPDVPIIEPRTMGQIVDVSLWPRRMVAWLFSGFAAMGAEMGELRIIFRGKGVHPTWPARLFPGPARSWRCTSALRRDGPT